MSHSPTAAQKLGFVLTRIVVPLWVLAGAAFKLVERAPQNLPKQIWQHGAEWGVNLHDLLAVLIAIEFVLAAVMLFVPRLARAAAIAMLSVFVLVLLNELRTGNFTNCGCLGKIPMKPWQMLAIDSLLLVGVIVFGRGLPATLHSKMASPLGAIAMSVVGIAGSALWVLPERSGATPVPPAVINDNDVIIRPRDPNTTQPEATTQPDSPADVGPQLPDSGTPSAGTPTVPDAATTPGAPPADSSLINPSPMPQPSTWFVQDIAAWVGKPWRELDLFKLMPVWPKGLDDPKRYVVFYSRTCEHCEAMFLDDLLIPLDAPITAIEIPQSRTVLTDPAAWDMPAYTHVEHAALPVGTTLWMVTPPLAIRLENGVIACATESEHKECLGIP